MAKWIVIQGTKINMDLVDTYKCAGKNGVANVYIGDRATGAWTFQYPTMKDAQEIVSKIDALVGINEIKINEAK